ncbi:acyl-CoA thioesterase [Bifidobacterium apicola]|uniref:acyl-CoA thioesterase n=1 Tax=Bifidobacterium apicola TaxID=3230739 RepID=UPI0036F219C3
MSTADESLARAIAALDVQKQQPVDGRSRFRGESLDFPTGRLYGGQLLGQAIMAGGRTVPEGRLPHSMHAYYLRTGLLKQDVQAEVETIRDGHSFSSRQVDLRQGERTILNALLSYQQVGQEGIRYSDPMPAGLPDPEDLLGSREQMEPYADQSPFADYYARQSPFDLRHVGGTVLLDDAENENFEDDSRSRQAVWSRTQGRADLDPLMRRALLAMECDQIMMEPALRRAGLSMTTPGISFASIDHAMWWYQDLDPCDWHCFIQESPVADHGRSLCMAKVYNRQGDLAAFMVQEAMIRVPKD